MALNEFFIMYLRCEKIFWKFWKKVLHQRDFLTPLAPNFDFFSEWAILSQKTFLLML